MVPYKFALEDLQRALEYARIEQRAVVQDYVGPQQLKGFGVELSLEELTCFGAELAIAVAYRKQYERIEDEPHDATVGVRQMLAGARLADHPFDNKKVLYFPGYMLVENAGEATV